MFWEISNKIRLFDFNCCANSCKSFFDLFSFVFSNCFFNCLGSAFNKFFSFLKTETCDLTNCLDNVELLVAERSKNYVKFCLFFSCGSCCATNCYCCYGSCRNAEFLFESLNEVCYFEDCKWLYLIENCCDLFRCHDNFPPIEFLWNLFF